MYYAGEYLLEQAVSLHEIELRMSLETARDPK